MVVQRGADRSAAVAAQLAVDLTSAIIAFYTGYNLSVTRALGPFTLAAEFVVYVLAMYLSISATLDVFSLITVGLATKRYSTSTSALLEAIQDMAGPVSGLDVVDKARKAVITVQILQALDQILERLKTQAGESMNEENFIRDLAGYLTLVRAQEAGFNVMEATGMSAQEAADVAAEFALVDSNDDGRIDFTEFRKLCNGLVPGVLVSEEEAAAAMSVLDTNSDGSVDFKEFVAWWKKNEHQIVAKGSNGNSNVSN